MTDPGYPTPDPNTPPAGGMPPQQPYPQAPFAPAPPPPGYASADDKTWALVATFGAAAGNLFCGVGGFVAPLVTLLAKGSSPTVRQYAVASLNFQMPISALAIILLIIRGAVAPDIFLGTGSTGLYLLAGLATGAVALVGIIFGILAGLAANNGTPYKYPFSLNIIK